MPIQSEHHGIRALKRYGFQKACEFPFFKRNIITYTNGDKTVYQDGFKFHAIMGSGHRCMSLVLRSDGDVENYLRYEGEQFITCSQSLKKIEITVPEFIQFMLKQQADAE